MNKRQWMMGGVALAAAAAGAGWAWWRHRPGEVSDGALDAFWTQDWADPNGQVIEMGAFKGQPLLVNFWATWCPPCVEELPMLNQFQRDNGPQGWRVVGLAVDQPSSVRKFLERLPLFFPVAMAGLGGTELSRQLGNTNGGLPFTVVIDSRGRIADRKIGKVDASDLAAWAAAHI